MYRNLKKYLAIIIIIYFIYCVYINNHDIISELPVFFSLIIITLIIHVYSVQINYVDNNSFKEKFRQALFMLIKNPLNLILVVFIAFILRFCLRYYFYTSIQGFYFIFLVIYITILPVKYMTNIIICSIKFNFNTKLLNEALKYSIKSFDEQVTTSLIWYSIIQLILSKAPFVIILKWSEIDYTNLSKIFFNNKQFLIRGVLIKVNFEPLLWEIIKIIPNISIGSKSSLNIIGEEVPLSENQIGPPIYYPSDDRFAKEPTSVYRLNSNNQPNNIMQFNANIHTTYNSYGTMFNKKFWDVASLRKNNEPRLNNPRFIHDLNRISNTPNIMNNVHSDYTILHNTKQFLANFLSNHTNSIKTDREEINSGIIYTDNVNNRCFLITTVNWLDDVKSHTPVESVQKANKLASKSNTVHDNKFVVAIYKNNITFYIYQENFLRNNNLIYKPGYGQSLVCITLGSRGVIPVPQTRDGNINIIPYDIKNDQNSILTLFNYIGTCREAPNLRFVNNTIYIDTPVSNILTEVRKLDSFNNIKDDGKIINILGN